jgi:hypothetical protein
MMTITPLHWSDCATNNEPAYPAGPCDCGGYSPGMRRADARLGKPPCGECHLQPGERCDICGASNPTARDPAA